MTVPPPPAPFGLCAKVRRYFVTNLAAVLPAAVATTVFVIARFMLVLPADCPMKPVVPDIDPDVAASLGNPAFCGPQALISAAFDAAWRRANAVAERGDPLAVEVPPDPQRTGLLLASQTGVFKEARARLLWLGAVGTKLAIAIAAIFGLLWMLVVQVEDFLLDRNLRLQGWSIRGLAALVAVTVICIAAVYAAAYWAVGHYLFAGLRQPPMTGEWVGFWSDPFSNLILGFIIDKLAPGGRRLIDVSDALIAAATVIIAAAVTMTLYQHPTQALRRVSEDKDPDYEHFLTRCFQRLMVCIYAGAALLVVCMAEIGARYSWPAALIVPADTTAKGVPAGAYKDLGDAFAQFAAQYQSGYGLLFTLLLAALYFPAWTILRRRAWQLVRMADVPASAGNNPSPADQEKWLTEHKMGFTGYQQLGHFIAILAPAGIGWLMPLLKLLGAG